MSRNLMSNYPKGFRKNVALRGMPVLTTFGGNVYWVDSNGGGGARGTFNHPDLTLNAAYDRCQANNGDIVMVKPGHSETITATVALDTAGVHIMGLGHGSKRPKVLCDMAAAADNAFEVSAAGQIMENIWIYDSNTTASSIAQVFVDVQDDGEDFALIGCRLDAKSATGAYITIQTQADDVLIQDCEFLCTSAPASSGPDYVISLEANYNEAIARRLVVDNCRFDFHGATATLPDTACINFALSQAYNTIVKDCLFSGVGNGKPVIKGATNSKADGNLMVHCYGQVADLTDLFSQTDTMTVIESYFTEAGLHAGAHIGGMAGNDGAGDSYVPSGTAVI